MESARTAVGNPDQRLDRQVCFALYAASRAMMDLYRPLLEPLGLTYPQYLVMLVLWQRNPQTVGEIAAELQLDYGTVSPVIKRLDTQGRLTRHRPPGNEATVMVQLTPSGSELCQQAADLPETLSCAVQRTDHEANQELIATLQELTQAARAAETPTVSREQDT